MADHRSRTALANSPRPVGRIMEPHNKRMQLTKGGWRRGEAW